MEHPTHEYLKNYLNILYFENLPQLRNKQYSTMKTCFKIFFEFENVYRLILKTQNFH